jgi:hypothetical protein
MPKILRVRRSPKAEAVAGAMLSGLSLKYRQRRTTEHINPPSMIELRLAAVCPTKRMIMNSRGPELAGVGRVEGGRCGCARTARRSTPSAIDAEGVLGASDSDGNTRPMTEERAAARHDTRRACT